MSRVTMRLGLTRQQAEDVLSALGFFIENHPDRRGTVRTRKDMVWLMANIWRSIRKVSARERKADKALAAAQRFLAKQRKAKRKLPRKASP